MGSMTFERWEGGKPAPMVEGVKREIRFDSSPRYSICKQFGFAEETYRQVEETRDSNFVTYGIYATASRDCPPERSPLVGKLIAKTRERIWTEQHDPYHAQVS